MLLNICEVGHPVLRQVARTLSIEDIQSNTIQDLIRDMRETMRAASGVGLAAPQIGESLRLIVVEGRTELQSRLTEDQKKEWPQTPFDHQIIVNPQMELLSPVDSPFFEGCLSIPGFMANVLRSHSIRVTCLDEHGEPQIIEAEGMYARILQHEIDHLNGILYTDRMQSSTFSTIENFKRYSAPPTNAASEQAKE